MKILITCFFIYILVSQNIVFSASVNCQVIMTVLPTITIRSPDSINAGSIDSRNYFEMKKHQSAGQTIIEVIL